MEINPLSPLTQQSPGNTVCGWPTDAQPDGNPSIQVLFLPPTTSATGMDWAHGSEVTLLTYRIVGMLTETPVTARPAGMAGNEGGEDLTREAGRRCCRRSLPRAASITLMALGEPALRSVRLPTSLGKTDFKEKIQLGNKLKATTGAY